IACFAFSAAASLLELLFFLTRSSPCPAKGDAGAATITYPSLVLAPLPQWEMLWMVWRPRTLAFGHSIDFCYALSSLSALHSTRVFAAFFLLRAVHTASKPEY